VKRFIPTPDVAAILHNLLDVYERRGGSLQRAIQVTLDEMGQTLSTYFSQTDPTPRVTANEQLAALATQGLVRLSWQPGQTNHLLTAVSLQKTLEKAQVEFLYALLEREPLAERRLRLRNLLLGDRFRLDGWRRQALEQCLAQIKDHKSPAPFSLTDDGWNRDLLAALTALPSAETREEIPYRVFSVRLFNDSKRFDVLKETVARLARRHQPAWHSLSNQEVLRELGLVANPGHLFLSGPWRLIDAQGQMMSLAEFYPSVGLPTALVTGLQQVRVDARRVVCVENLAAFYELIRHEGRELAAVCLWGNPSPASRHLLRCLAGDLPQEVSLLLWADIDYGGLNILGHLRQQVSPRIAPYRMDRATLDAHVAWAQPLAKADVRNLTRLKRQPALTDMAALIDHMLLREIKLEQEAVALGEGITSKRGSQRQRKVGSVEEFAP
jgi:hypothetical protein